MTNFIDYATVSITDSDKLSVIHKQLKEPRRFRIRFWHKTNKEWDTRIGYFDDKSKIWITQKGTIAITYVDTWEDDGGHTQEQYRTAIVDDKHQVFFQTRKRVEL